MAEKLIIVHGYSDGYVEKNSCFRELKNYLADNGAYEKRNISFVEYSSMDDQATYEDFADKFNSEYEQKNSPGKRVDVLCHSTGALVTRVWLANRRKQQREFGRELDLPVDKIFMFAPANFGSDLARMGQSFLGKLRCTFFNSNARKGNRFESGEIVLQGLEPASPFQWLLSCYDLHQETYFGPNDPTGLSCKVFVFAAGEGYDNLQSKVVKDRNKPGTDGTVRICGSDLNTRKCSLLFTDNGQELLWCAEHKYESIPFTVFQGVNHGSLINPNEAGFNAPDGPGALLLKAIHIETEEQYKDAAIDFHIVSENNYKIAQDDNGDRYQQFFFKVRDDAGFSITDFYIDFFVQTPTSGGSYVKNQALTRSFDKLFAKRVTVHSQDRSHRAFLVNLKHLKDFYRQTFEKQARLILEVSAKKPYDEVSYPPGRFVVFDTTLPFHDQTNFIYENTTTLVEIIMNRRQSDEILKLHTRLG